MMDWLAVSAAIGCKPALALAWSAPLERSMLRYEINTKRREAAFLAQIAHESMRLSRTRELWGPTPAQLRYEGRKDLGNVVPGDGFRFLGRGLIQTTGRGNYRRCSLALFGDERLLDQPELLEQKTWAAQSAGWFWRDEKNLNELADAGMFKTITRRINGGLNGYEERLALYESIWRVLA